MQVHLLCLELPGEIGVTREIDLAMLTLNTQPREVPLKRGPYVNRANFKRNLSLKKLFLIRVRGALSGFLGALLSGFVLLFPKRKGANPSLGPRPATCDPPHPGRPAPPWPTRPTDPLVPTRPIRTEGGGSGGRAPSPAPLTLIGFGRVMWYPILQAG